MAQQGPNVPKYSTKEQSDPRTYEEGQRLFCPIISIDHLSQDFQDLPVDRILAIGDQALLYQLEHDDKAGQFYLSQPIDEPDVFGPLVNHFYETL